MIDIGPTRIGVVLRDPKGELRGQITEALERGEQLFMSKPKAAVTFPAWRCERDSMGGSKMDDTVYTDEKVAKMRAEERKEEFCAWKVHEVIVRFISETEGAVGRELVTVDHTSYTDALRQRALKKLTPEERKALGH